MEPLRSVSLAVVDDHQMFRSGITQILKGVYNVSLQASNGSEFIDKIKSLPANEIPEVVLLDISMPEMDGFETSEWLRRNFPKIKVIVLSDNEDAKSVAKALRLGAKGYLSKNDSPEQLLITINDVVSKGMHYTDRDAQALLEDIKESEDNKGEVKLSAREIELLSLLASELTLKEIARKMNVSLRTVDNLKENLSAKLELKTRVQLVMYAMRQNLIQSLL